MSRMKLGSNWLVLIGALIVGLLAFVAAIGVSNSRRPATMEVLAAARDLNVGEVVQATDVVVITVYQDARTSYYVPVDQLGALVGGWVAIPVMAGQPITRQSIIAAAGVGERLSAVLAEYGEGYRLFTVPLDAQNMVAPDVDVFMPGDLVGITIVIGQRPQGPATPTPDYGSGFVITPTPSAQEVAVQEATERIWPPLATDLFPQGLRVVAVYGKQASPQAVPTGEAGSSLYQPSYTDYNRPKYVVVLVPTADVERLSLALMSADKVYVSLMAIGVDTPTSSFSYWDLEDLLIAQREGILRGGQP